MPIWCRSAATDGDRHTPIVSSARDERRLRPIRSPKYRNSADPTSRDEASGTCERLQCRSRRVAGGRQLRKHDDGAGVDIEVKNSIVVRSGWDRTRPCHGRRVSTIARRASPPHFVRRKDTVRARRLATGVRRRSRRAPRERLVGFVNGGGPLYVASHANLEQLYRRVFPHDAVACCGHRCVLFGSKNSTPILRFWLRNACRLRTGLANCLSRTASSDRQ